MAESQKNYSNGTLIASKRRYAVALDAGGTMTDTVIMDEMGRYYGGKALTNSQDESVSVLNSIGDAARYTGASLEEVLGNSTLLIYSGTAMLNTVLTRTGLKTGLLITKGLEDYPLMERGHTWLGYSYEDRMHPVTHVHQQPLVPRHLVKGATERVDMFGEVVIPLYEKEVEEAVRELIDDGIEALVILFMNAQLNPAHERRAAELANLAASSRGRNVLIRCGSDVAPIIREYSRLFSTLIQASASERSRQQLLRIEEVAKAKGYKGGLLTQLSYGGLTNIRYERLYETLISGPVGGYSGSKYIGDLLGEANVLTIDLGGTSLDVGIIRAGIMNVVREPTVAGFRINLPMLNLESVGGGTGTAIRVNPTTKRIELGPDCAGHRVGSCNTYPVPTITDCSLVLGHLDPNYFVGGEIKLNKDAALRGVRQFADELGVELYEAAAGVIDLQSTILRSHLKAMLLGRGFSPLEFVALIFGGAGPLHMHAMVEGIVFKDVITFPFAGVFSAFGTLTTDYSHRYARSLLAPLPPLGVRDEQSRRMTAVAAKLISEAWRELREKAKVELRSEGILLEQVTFKNFAYMRYTGQFQDYETLSPLEELHSPEDTLLLVQAFEDAYGKIYPEASKYPEAGYMISEVAVVASFAMPKPIMQKWPLKGKEAPPEAYKGEREAYHKGLWSKFTVLEMDRLEAGNVVEGPAIIEHPATTLFIPPGHIIRFDEFRIIHYS